MAATSANLRQARESRGISLEEVSRATKIRVSYLEALENWDLDRLPAGAFGRGFVRAYAEQVGIAPEEVLEAFDRDRESSGPEPTASEQLTRMQELLLGESRPTPKGPSWAVVAVAAAAVVAVVLGLSWLISRTGDEPAAPTTVAAEGSGTMTSGSSTPEALPVETAPPPTTPPGSPEGRTAPRTASATPGSGANDAPALRDAGRVAGGTPVRDAGPAGTTGPAEDTVPAAPATEPAAPTEEAELSEPGAAELTTLAPILDDAPLPAEREPTQPEALPEAKPTRAEPAAPPPAPKVETPPPARRATRPSSLRILNAGVGTDVVNLQLRGQSGVFPERSRVWFWTEVLGGKRGDSIRHVWLYGDRVIFTKKLRVDSARWRTYTYKTLPAGMYGTWAVEARDASGRGLARVEFEAVPRR